DAYQKKKNRSGLLRLISKLHYAPTVCKASLMLPVVMFAWDVCQSTFLFCMRKICGDSCFTPVSISILLDTSLFSITFTKYPSMPVSVCKNATYSSYARALIGQVVLCLNTITGCCLDCSFACDHSSMVCSSL